MKKKSKTNIIILMALGILFAVSSVIINYTLTFNMGNGDNSLGYYDNANLDNKSLKLSKTSGKIHIINNSGWIDFRNDGNCTGSGTYSDPYVIEDLVIDGGGSGSCIWIENSNVYFRIENCTLYYSGGFPNAGIRLYNVIKGKLVINNCTSNYFGIRLLNCNNNTILGNTASNNTNYGVYLRYSSNNTISGNIVNNNYGDGIHLCYSDNNTISRNTANNNKDYGIYLVYSDNSIISENTANNNRFGIYINQSDVNNIAGNIVSDNEHGICVFLSSNNTIVQNTANNNDWDGIDLKHSDYNIIWGNTANNNYYGIYLVYSDNNIISGNTANNNGWDGIDLWGSDYNIISGNTVNNNIFGIFLGESNNNIVSGNRLTGNNVCIAEVNCQGNQFSDNGACTYVSFETSISFMLISSISGGAVIGVATLLLIRHKRFRKK